MRGAAQLISYEVSMGLALLGVIMMGGSLSLVDIVEAQGAIWFVVPQLVGFLIFMLAGFAETNRTPFDMPEADAELVQGFMTEYGGMRFGSFLMVEYLEIIVVCGVAAAMFLGGWMGPGPASSTRSGCWRRCSASSSSSSGCGRRCRGCATTS